MKKVIGLFSFLMFLGTVSMTAQENTNVNPETTATSTNVKKSCSKSKKSCAATCAAKASKAASMDDNIEKSVCPVSGTAHYKRKSMNEETGEITYSDVEYNSKSASFVNLPTATAVSDDTNVKAHAKSCAKGSKKGCSKKCSKDCKKACCSSDKTSTETIEEVAPSEGTSGS